MKIEEGTKVKVISGEKMFEGVVEKTEWDFVEHNIQRWWD
jgi:hypothetical protein